MSRSSVLKCLTPLKYCVSRNTNRCKNQFGVLDQSLWKWVPNALRIERGRHLPILTGHGIIAREPFQNRRKADKPSAVIMSLSFRISLVTMPFYKANHNRDVIEDLRQRHCLDVQTPNVRRVSQKEHKFLLHRDRKTSCRERV